MATKLEIAEKNAQLRERAAASGRWREELRQTQLELARTRVALADAKKQLSLAKLASSEKQSIKRVVVPDTAKEARLMAEISLLKRELGATNA